MPRHSGPFSGRGRTERTAGPGRSTGSSGSGSPQPSTSTLTVDLVRWLGTAEAQVWLEDERIDPSDPVSAMLLLRKALDLPQAAAIIEQRRCRLALRKSRKISTEWAQSLLFDRTSFEQASSWPTALYKAGMLARLAGSGPIVDVACGVGIDTIALAKCGREVLAIDSDPVRLAMLEHNARMANVAERVSTRAQVADASLDLRGFAAFHCDPDRRRNADGSPQRSRTHGLDDACPPWADICQWLTGCPLGVVKASPGLDLGDLLGRGSLDIDDRDDDWTAHRPPEPTRSDVTGRSWDLWLVEHVSERNDLKQTLLWLASPDAHPRLVQVSADVWPPGDAPASPADSGRLRAACGVDALGERAYRLVACDDELWPPPAEAIGDFLYEPHSAVIRAGLVGALAKRFALRPVHPRICYLTGPAANHPALTRFGVLAVESARVETVADWLTSHHGRCHEVLRRGVDLDTDTWQQQLNRATNRAPTSDAPITPLSVILTRLACRDNRPCAIIAQRMRSGEEGAST